MSADESRWQEVDREIVGVAKGIKLLSALEWGPEVREEFLAGVKSGQPRVPEPIRPAADMTAACDTLARAAARVTDDHPVDRYLRATAESYICAARMLENVGTPTFNELGRQLYGSPNQRIAQGNLTVLDAAERFLTVSSEMSAACAVTEGDLCIVPEAVVRALVDRAQSVFTRDPVVVQLDEQLTSKAAAGAKRVRVRASTCFSRDDVPQLVEHELMVHTLTAVNGRAQPNLSSFGLGAPRTTATQEGLAVFAELITGSMDLNRLRRIALRPKGLQLALDGADFVEIFRFFRESGQEQGESYSSAQRLFRGGDPRGGIVFLKDGIYLMGLLAVHNFLRKALEERRLHTLNDLFAGRLALSDVLDLEPFFRSGWVEPPRYEPDWVTQRSRLASFLTYSDFIHGVDLHDLTLEDLAHITEESES